MELEQVLAALAKHNVASAEVPLSNGVLRVVFAPSMAPLPGEAPEPGGWKSPPNLDQPFETEVP